MKKTQKAPDQKNRKSSVVKEGKAPFSKGAFFTVQITDLGNDGEGIGKVDGYTLFIKDAIPGDVVNAKLMKAKKNYGYAHLEEILTPSPDRVAPACPVARACGGCQIQAMSYEGQLRFKQNKVRNNLIRLGGFAPEEIDGKAEPIIGMEQPFRYRNKAQFPIGTDREGNPIAGFYAGRTHSIIPVEDCLLGSEKNKEILDIILNYMREYQVPAYNEETGEGLIRHVLIREGYHSGQIMVCLVITGKKSVPEIAKDEAKPRRAVSKRALLKIGEQLPYQSVLLERLTSVSGMTSISVSINSEKTNVIMGTEIHTIWGADTIEDTLQGLTFKISPLSFYQVNPVQTERLYGKAIQYAGLTGKETVWDLYCGIGTITLSMARDAAQVYGVEIVPQAIEDARNNAKANGITNAAFYVGKAEEVLPEKYASEGIHADVIVVDPPRKGCDADCLQTMLKMQPERIVYVSCDSATLARDLRTLVDGGYELVKYCPVDMFSQTVHVETVCLLSKLHEAKHHVNVTVDMDEMDLTKAESKATYKEIQEYVMEHTGLHVTNLNIAQVKAKNGLEMRENFNLPKSENSRQPGCPEEKVKAIEDALRHFQMI